MIIVAGWLRVRPQDRQRYLDSCVEVMRLARSAAGCRDFHLAADPLEEDRINVFERWSDRETLEAFRSGPSEEQAAAILSAEVVEFSVVEAASG